MKTDSKQPLLIPLHALDSDTLVRIIEEFVTREGTDYGPGNFSLPSKIQSVERQLQSGEAVILYDPTEQSVNIVTRRIADTLLKDPT